MLFSHSRFHPGLAVLKVYKQKRIEITRKNTCIKSVSPVPEGLDIGVNGRLISKVAKRERDREREREPNTKESQNRKCYTKVLTHAELRQLPPSQIFRTV